MIGQYIRLTLARVPAYTGRSAKHGCYLVTPVPADGMLDETDRSSLPLKVAAIAAVDV